MFRESSVGVIVCNLRYFFFDETDSLLLGALSLNNCESYQLGIEYSSADKIGSSKKNKKA